MLPALHCPVARQHSSHVTAKMPNGAAMACRLNQGLDHHSFGLCGLGVGSEADWSCSRFLCYHTPARCGAVRRAELEDAPTARKCAARGAIWAAVAVSFVREAPALATRRFPTVMTPRLANIIIAADGDVNSATAPISSAPIGPAPMASDMTPNARPRISSDAVMTMMVDCMVPTPPCESEQHKHGQR